MLGKKEELKIQKAAALAELFIKNSLELQKLFNPNITLAEKIIIHTRIAEIQRQINEVRAVKVEE